MVEATEHGPRTMSSAITTEPSAWQRLGFYATSAPVLSFGVLILFLVAWEFAPRAFGIPTYILPPISRVWDEALNMVANERLWFHTWVTAAEVVVGFALGALLGMSIGYLLGISPKAELVL